MSETLLTNTLPPYPVNGDEAHTLLLYRGTSLIKKHPPPWVYVNQARSEILNGTSLMMGMIRLQVRGESEREREREIERESAR